MSDDSLRVLSNFCATKYFPNVVPAPSAQIILDAVIMDMQRQTTAASNSYLQGQAAAAAVTPIQ